MFQQLSAMACSVCAMAATKHWSLDSSTKHKRVDYEATKTPSLWVITFKYCYNSILNPFSSVTSSKPPFFRGLRSGYVLKLNAHEIQCPQSICFPEGDRSSAGTVPPELSLAESPCPGDLCCEQQGICSDLPYSSADCGAAIFQNGTLLSIPNLTSGILD